MINLQKKAYHNPRFFTQPHTPKHEVFNSKFAWIYDALSDIVEIKRAYVEIGNLVIFVDKNVIFATMERLKEIGFNMLSDMSAIHLSDDSFEVFYQVLNMQKVQRVRVKTSVESSVDSICEIYRNALWAEREAYDMFGIKFLNHPHLKRILMPDDWSGHPLRKDYPLHGDESAKWYEVDKIFGEEYRAIIGEERRDSSLVDERDTLNFANLGFEVPRGAAPKENGEETQIKYQEDGGIPIVEKFKTSQNLKERR